MQRKFQNTTFNNYYYSSNNNNNTMQREISKYYVQQLLQQHLGIDETVVIGYSILSLTLPTTCEVRAHTIN